MFVRLAPNCVTDWLTDHGVRACVRVCAVRAWSCGWARQQVNLISKSGYSPLHLASQNGASDIVELLLSNKAVADVPNHKGQTALHVLAMSWDSASATKHKTLQLVDRLLNHLSLIHI